MDISFKIGNEKFNYRVCAMIISDGKILAMHDERSPYYYLPGGRVAIGETAENAVIREVWEELGVTPKIVRPVWLNQAFFTEDVDNLHYHELCIYFLMDITDTDLLSRGKKFTINEGDRIHTFEWLGFAQLKDEYFYPSVLTVGCKKHNAEYTSSEKIGDVSFIVSEKAAESETVSSAGNVSSTLSANVAQGSSAESSNIAEPNKTVSQIREQPKTSPAAPSKTDTAQTPPETKPEIPANATAADTKAVADRVIYYLNRARANIGSGELKKLPRLTGYAEYRSSQLPSNFAHDISDGFAAAKATGYGRYTEMPDGSGSYDIGAQEAIAMAGVVGSADKIGQCLAQIIIDSSRH